MSGRLAPSSEMLGVKDWVNGAADANRATRDSGLAATPGGIDSEGDCFIDLTIRTIRQRLLCQVVHL